MIPTPTVELIAGFRLAQPEFTYGALRGLSPRPLPQSLQVLLPSLLGLNAASSGRFGSGLDWLGVVTAEPNGALGWAVGVPVVSGRELVAELASGADARLRAQSQSGWTELTGLSGGLLGPLRLGVSGNYLIFGPSPTAVRTLAPWLGVRAGASALAPEQADTGLSLRLFASGFTLQALHAYLRERWDAASSPWSRAIDGAVARSQVANIEMLLNDTLSAYLGSLRGGDVHLRWRGDKLELRGDFRVAALPPSPSAVSPCQDITSLPADVKFWIAGTGRPPETQGATTGADWDRDSGAWQAALLEGFLALAASFDGRVHLKSGVAFADGPWVVGWREQGGASTALAVLRGVPPNALEATPPLVATPTGNRVQARTGNGKVLEWSWAPRGAGMLTAFGAQLGPLWDLWVQSPAGTGWPNGLSPRICDGLVFAAGTRSSAVLAVSRSEGALRVQGDLDLSILGGLLR